MADEDEASLHIAGRKLFPFQAHGVQWMLMQEILPTRLWDQDVTGGLLCDDMGLGKTIQTIAVIKRRPLPRTIVVVPVAVLRPWEEMLAEAGCAVYELQAGDKVRPIVLRDVPLTARPADLADRLDTDSDADSDSSDESKEEDDDTDRADDASEGEGEGKGKDKDTGKGGDTGKGKGKGKDKDKDRTDLDMVDLSEALSDADEPLPPGATSVRELHYASKAINIEAMPPTPVAEDGTADAPCVVVATYGKVKPLVWQARSEELGSGVRPLATVAWDRIVLDEGHVIRNTKTLTAARMTRLVRAPGCAAWVLTGTPVHNKKDDLFALFAFLGYNLMRVPRTVRDAAVAWAAKAMRRTMADVPADVRRSMAYPEEDFSVTEHAVAYRSEGEADFYRAATGTIMEQLAALDGYTNRREAAQHRLVLTLFLRLLAVHPQIYIGACNKQRAGEGMDAWPAWTGRVSKNEEVMELVAAWRAEGASFVLFTHFKEELEQFKDALAALDYAVLTIDGSQSGAQRFDVLARSRRLAAAGTLQALLVQITAGGVGLNIQHLDRVIIPSPDWVPNVEAQAIARCHRMGQTKRVQVHRFFLAEVMRAGMQIEQKILQQQAAKNALVGRIVTSTVRYT